MIQNKTKSENYIKNKNVYLDLTKIPSKSNFDLNDSEKIKNHAESFN